MRPITPSFFALLLILGCASFAQETPVPEPASPAEPADVGPAADFSEWIDDISPARPKVRLPRPICQTSCVDNFRADFAEITPFNRGTARAAGAFIGRELGAGNAWGLVLQAENPDQGPGAYRYERGGAIFQMLQSDAGHARDGVTLDLRALGVRTDDEPVRVWALFVGAGMWQQTQGPLVGIEVAINHRDPGRGNKKAITVESPAAQSDYALLVKGRRGGDDRGPAFASGIHLDSGAAAIPISYGPRHRPLFAVGADGKITSPTIDELRAEILWLTTELRGRCEGGPVFGGRQ